jgi:hypothetical protein
VEEVILLPEVIFKLNQLVNILYDEEYFGFMDTAFNYADNIYDFIYTIPKQQYKFTSNKKLGTYYCSFKANRNTTWYITFDKQEEKYIVQNITNNHSADYAYFIANIK